jgi:inner membrane protein involved in colicin E2 resistance
VRIRSADALRHKDHPDLTKRSPPAQDFDPAFAHSPPMTTLRLFTIAFILIVATIAWFVLGASVTARSGEFDQRLASDVAQLWGGRHRQTAPSVLVERERQVDEKVKEQTASGRTITTEVRRTVIDTEALPLLSSLVDVDLRLEHRQKGLLWYDTYTVTFSGRYTVRNPDGMPRPLIARLAFPSKNALYDQFAVRFNGMAAPPLTDLSHGVEVRSVIPAGATASFDVKYVSRGLDEWRYALAEAGVSQVQNLTLRLTTDFDDVDFPPGTMSPTSRTRIPRGWRLDWTFASLVTGQAIGVDLPNRTNPGPLAARITFFAPVSLLFFVTVLVILGILSGENLHPMNYAFVSAAFFAFHLLLAYLVDHLQIHVAFGISALTSILLVVSYLRLVAGTRFALVRAGLAQLVFLIFFSYAFFFDGFTGLTVTIGSIVTLFILMQATAKLDWSQIFEGQPARS